MRRPEIKAEFARILEDISIGKSADMIREVGDKRCVRRFVPEERLIVLGGGHIALPVCRFHHEFINFFWHLDVVPIVLFFMYLGHVVFKNGILSKIAQTPKYFYGAAFLCLLITAASGSVPVRLRSMNCCTAVL